MTITQGATVGPVKWATFDANPNNGHPSGFEHPELQALPVAIYEALYELSDGTVCATKECEQKVGAEILDNDDGVPSSERWHDVTIFLTPEAAAPTALCEECAYPALTALTGKAPW